MKGSAFVSMLSEKPTREREEMVWSAVQNGWMRPIRWAEVHAYAGGHHAVLKVMEDALAIGDETDFVRVNTNHTTAQRIADLLGLSLPTSRISDLIHMQATVRLKPCLHKADAQIAYTHRMVEHSKCVDERRGGRLGLVGTVGKDWVLTNRLVGRPNHAANYGWHDRSAPNGNVWQTVGLAHDRWHVDYSQVLRFVQPTAIVDGEERALSEVLTSPSLFGLVSSEGPLALVRHPGVPMEEQRVYSDLELPRDGMPMGMGVELPNIPFIGAKSYGRANGRSVSWVVIHTAEVAERPNSAAAVAAFFATPGAGVSAHYCVDADSIVQCVHEEDIAYHARGSNEASIGVELSGRASQTAADWADDYSTRTLDLSAKLFADVCKRRMLPVDYVDAAGLQAGARGITTHSAVSQAFRRSTHTDPGRNFPMEGFLAKVRMYRAAL